jgi:hypothetical protein
VQLDQMANDRQSQAQAALFTGAAPLEPIENARQQFGGNANGLYR